MSDELTESSSKTLASPKLSKVVLIVLAAHVVLILGFVTFCLLKGSAKDKDGMEVAATDTPAGQTEVASTNNNSNQPVVETSVTDNSVNNVAPVMTATETAAAVSTTTTAPTPVQPNRGPVWSAPTAQPNPASTPAIPTVTPTVNPNPPAVARTTPATTSAAGSYTVQKGDTLYKIARKNGTNVAALKQANGLSTDALKIGQKLNIPGKTTTVAATAVASQQPTVTPVAAPAVVQPAVASANTGIYQNYKVVAGDTLWKIARSFNTKPDVIAKANNISDPSKLKVGMQIKVPSQSQQTAQPVAQPQVPIPNVDVAAVPQNRN